MGGAGRDNLSASDGNDTLGGGLGDDLISGGRGADLFVFEARFGHDILGDFNPGEDDIRFSGVGGLASFDDVMAHAVQSGTNVIITDLAGDTLQLNNVLRSSLTSGDFLFS